MTLNELSLEEKEEYNIWFDEMHLTPSKGCHFVTRYDGDTLVIREVIYEK